MTDSPALVVQGLTKTYGARAVVDDVSFSLATGSFLSLIGPSGSGKTTVLRMIAGLIRPDSGRITLAGQPIFDGATNVPAEDRGLGMVFQDFALWPHMTVGQNIAFGLRLRHIANSTIQRRVAEMLNLVDLDGMARRFPFQLSGGQQQRVALARALATNPRLLLLDEPLSSLDTSLREAMRDELITIVRRAHMTVINVTHDQDEAMSLSDQIILLRQGQIQQVGSPAQLYQTPRSAFVGRFMGPANVLPGIARSVAGDTASVAWGDHIFTGHVSWPDLAIGQPVGILCRPEDLELLTEQAPNDMGVIRGTVERETFTAGRWRVLIRVTDTMLIHYASSRMLGTGQSVALRLPPAATAIIRLDEESMALAPTPALA